MNIKVPASELNRMMKALSQCIDQKDQTKSNIEIIFDNGFLTARATNGQFAAVVSTPLLGGDGESFCIDGTMFARVCSMCTGDVNIITDGKVCTIKGAGRTRIPIVDVKIPNYERVIGSSFTLAATLFAQMYDGVSYALSTDANRLVLTGVYVENKDNTLTMAALDGFKMSTEKQTCNGDAVGMVIPGSFMKLIRNNTSAGEDIKFTTNGKRVQVDTDGMMISSSLLANDYPDYKRILPETFKTEVLVDLDVFKNALRNSSVICSTSKLVKLVINDSKIIITGNSEQAEYEDEINCLQEGDGLTIAFNQKYLMDTVNSIAGEKIIMKFNSPINPCVITKTNIDGCRLLLPVRVAG